MARREDFSALAAWLLTRALEHDKPSPLFQLVCEHLRAEKSPVELPDLLILHGAAASLSLGTVRQKLVGVLSSDVEVGLSGKGEAL